MDSLTQIVLGAACGEAVAGRRLGNRAMLWGAVGGTIPDLDVFAALFADEITSTSFHRGFMHSFLFAALLPWILALLTHWFYHNGIYRRKGYKLGAMIVWILFYLGAAIGINFIPVLLGEGLSWFALIPTLLLGIWLVRNLWNHYWKPDLHLVEAPYMTWVALFFLSIFTHPILDCFTNWGTQIWQPFADTRVQWNTIFVADPLYTIPFAACLLLASRLHNTSKTRFILNWTGILLSSGYLGYTVWHKTQVDTRFEEKLNLEKIAFQRYMTGPTVLNNIVWYGLAESDTAYHFGLFGFNDQPPEFGRLSAIPKNHHLLMGIPADDRALHFIRWFSNDYYNVIPYHDDTLQVNDLRFGLFGDSLSGKNYVFPFLLFKNEAGEWDVIQNREAQNVTSERKAEMTKLWERVKGK